MSMLDTCWKHWELFANLFNRAVRRAPLGEPVTCEMFQFEGIGGGAGTELEKLTG
jgi:hypothetical protein